MFKIFINNTSFFEPNSKCIFKNTDFPHKPPTIFQAVTFRLIFLTFSYSFKPCNIFKNFVNLFSCRFHYLNLICNIENFIESCQFSELPSIFNSVMPIEFPTNHLLYFMTFAQLNSFKDAPCFHIPIFYFVFIPLLFTFLSSKYNSSNGKTILSLERGNLLL